MNIKKFSLTIASVNGSGTQTANNCLAKALFRHGAYVGAKYLFPSNIAGLPTWFSIRTHENGFVSREEKSDIFIARNKDTLKEDFLKTKKNGFFFYDAEWDLTKIENTNALQLMPIP